MKIIDAHVHLSPPSALGRGEERLGSRLERNGRRMTADGGFRAMPPYLTDSCFSEEGLIALIDAYGVEAAVIQQTPLSGSPENRTPPLKLTSAFPYSPASLAGETAPPQRKHISCMP